MKQAGSGVDRRAADADAPSIPQVDPTDDVRTGDTAAAADPPWLDWPVGAKVMVRRRLPDGGYADTVGILVERDAAHLVVHGRRGEVVVPAAEVAIGKVVPAPVLGPRRG